MWKATLFLLFLVETALAGPVNWVHFPKMHPWDFEAARPAKNHANMDPEIYLGWVDAKTPDIRPIDRIRNAARIIHDSNFKPSLLRAVLLRDVIDVVEQLHPVFSSFDQQAANGILFIGRALDSEKRFALAFSYDDGRFYSGRYSCETVMREEPTLDFSDTSSWRPLFPEAAPPSGP